MIYHVFNTKNSLQAPIYRFTDDFFVTEIHHYHFQYSQSVFHTNKLIFGKKVLDILCMISSAACSI